MSPHLKQGLFNVSLAGRNLEQQTTGSDLENLEKAKLLDKLIYEIKEMLEYAVGDLEVPENTFDCLLVHINAIDEDGELAEVITKLKEATGEPADGPSRDHVKIV